MPDSALLEVPLRLRRHPVQYMSPLLQRMAGHPRLDMSRTAYCRLRGAKAGVDPEFGAKIQWDIPLLDGYDWVEIPNKGTDSEGFFGLYNPGLWKLVRRRKIRRRLLLYHWLHPRLFLDHLSCQQALSLRFLFGTDATSLAPRDSSRWKGPVTSAFWPLLYRLASQVVAPSSGTCDLMRSLGIPTQHVTRVPFVVDNDWWIAQSRLVDRDAVRASWGARPDSSVILFCAKLQPWKRPLDLLQAFAQAKLANSLLVFAGEGPLREALQSEAARLGCDDKVRFLGFVNQSQLPACYSRRRPAPVSSPPNTNPSACVVNEAMLCGCIARGQRPGGGGPRLPYRRRG